MINLKLSSSSDMFNSFVPVLTVIDFLQIPVTGLLVDPSALVDDIFLSSCDKWHKPPTFGFLIYGLHQYDERPVLYSTSVPADPTQMNF